MAYTDKTDTFEYKLRIDNGDLFDLSSNDQEIALQIPQFNRPLLRWVSATEIGLRTNKGGAPQESDILFSDGHRVIAFQTGAAFTDIFDITRTANWTTGDDGGLRPGLSESNNTWYAIYMVRTTFSSVMVGDDTLPLQANINTLDTRYGKDRWAYLGMVRNGDNVSAPGDLLEFVNVRDRFYFLNDASDGGGNFNDGKGIRLAAGTSIDLDWAYSAGLGSTDLPGHLNLASFHVSAVHDTTNYVGNSAGTKVYINSGAPGFSSAFRENLLVNPKEGVKIFGANSEDRAILLTGYVDNVLGLGYNALI